MIASTLVLPIERAVINWYDGKSAPIRAVPRRPGTDFMAMGREHPFSFTLAMSLFADRERQDELDPLHSKLVESDLELMPLAEYPLSRDSTLKAGRRARAIPASARRVPADRDN